VAPLQTEEKRGLVNFNEEKRKITIHEGKGGGRGRRFPRKGGGSKESLGGQQEKGGEGINHDRRKGLTGKS